MSWEPQPRSDLGGLWAITAGQGPLVVLLHGVGLRAEAWAGQITALAQRCRVLAPDLPGHGQSPALTGPVTLKAYSDRVAAALPGPAIVIGHSMGAMIALDLAARFPTRVRGVAALNAIFERSPEAKAAVSARAASLDGQTPADPEPTLDRWFGQSLSAERAACERWLTTVDPGGYRTAYQTFAASDGPSRASLAGLTCPALFLTGALEPNSTPAMSRAMAAFAPQGRAQIIDGAAHMMPMTHPAEVNAALVSFAAEASDKSRERS